MRKFLLFSLFGYAISGTCFAQSQTDLINLAQATFVYAKIAKSENLPSELVVTYNFYQIVAKRIVDKTKIKEIDDFFEELKTKYPTAFRNLIVSMFSPPTFPVTGVFSGSKSLEIEKFQSLLNKGYSLGDLNLKGLGDLNKLDLGSVPQKQGQ